MGTGAEVGKIGHFAVFLLLGVIGGLNFHKIGALYSLALISAFASLTEVLQLLVVGRTTSVNDFLIDVTGGAIGFCFGMAIYVFFGGDDAGQPDPQQLNKNRRSNRFATIKNLKKSLRSLRP